MARVVFEHIVKEFGNVRAVDDLSLEIQDGEFICLIGPSGCGKTTSLRMVAGLERPTHGELYFNQEPVGHLPPNYRDIAMVFQSYALYPHMKVADNLAFPLRNLGVKADEIGRKVAWVAELLGLTQLLQRRPKELSGGQRQRVALGRAIIRQPAVFLLDEPLSNLDAKLRVSMRGEIKKLHGELKKTFIYVTHDQAEAMTMADRVAVMNHGKLMQVGTPYEVYRQPANLFVAGFVGSPPINLVEGELVQENGAARVQWEGGSYPVPAELAHRAAAQTVARRVVMGVRPEDVALSTNRGASLSGQVYLVEPMGSDTFVTVEVGAAHVRLRADADAAYQEGDKVRIALPPSRLHLFDAESGAAVR